MFTSDCYNINENNHLTIGGCDTVELAKKYGTPLYVLDEATIRNSCRSFKNSIDEYYDGFGLACYASKALSCLEMCRIIKEEGLGLDVVSGGELYTAIKAGFPVDKIHFHGNNKTRAELEMAVEYNVGTVVVDNLYELDTLNGIAKSHDKSVDISLRIKPGIDAHTHSFVKTGQIDSKFGFALETGEAFEAVKTSSSYENLNLVELHCHIGSQIFDVEPFVLAAQTMINFMGKIKKELGLTIRALNLGGGFGIKYTDHDKPTEYNLYMKDVSNAIKEATKINDIPMPFILIEPGRSIVGEAGITLYEIGGIKNIPSIRTYVSIDGGMTDNPRYALYGSGYTATIANRAADEANTVVTIAGKCCESGDLIQENINIQEPVVSDILAVFSTGAYNYSMASNYNRIPKPAIVMVNNGKDRLIVKRESYDDIIKNDI